MSARTAREGNASDRSGVVGLRPPFEAVIFEMDAVVAGTAVIHGQLPEAHGPQLVPGSEALLRRLRVGRVPVGLVTERRSAQPLLASAGIRDVFDVVLDGTTAGEPGWGGRPDPAMFLAAVRQLGLTPAQVAVVGTTAAGVRAASSGDFGLVVGIARDGDRAVLEAAGADLVVEDVGQLDLGSFRADPWILTYEGFDPAHESHREALTALGNGYLGTRGAAPEARADGVHYPGSYLAGVYNRLTSAVAGRQVDDEHLVNQPNWLRLDLRIGTGAWWSDGGLELVQERRDLDMRAGILTRRAVLADSSGRRLRLVQRRLVSMARPHLAALETTLLADGWEGTVTARSGIDAGVRNANVAADRDLANRHLTAVSAEHHDSGVLLVEAQTTQSRVLIATAARTVINGETAMGRPVEPAAEDHAVEFVVELRAGAPSVIDKTVALVTSKDAAIASPAEGAVGELARAPRGFAALADEHRAAWSLLWNEAAIAIPEAPIQDQLVLNLHVFHLLQALSPHTAALDAGVPARGLHGEGYRGHVFWDELFVLPVLTAHLPAVARSLLDYRWRRLPTARDAASQQGLKGAMFPWQSGSDGREQTPQQLYNPRSRRWIPDNSRRQRHVGLAVAYNAWQYYQATGDLDWLTAHGAELVVEVARLFASMSSYDAAQDRFHIDAVMGPDEYHDGYPETPGSGLRDNAYTNVMAAWVSDRASEVLGLLRCEDRAALAARIDLDDAEPARWEQLSRRIAVPFHDGVISQFDGYAALQELDWDRYRATYGNIGRLDLILEAEGDTTNRYKLAKQADVLMLVYVLGADELCSLLERLGYPIDATTLRKTVDYYLARTAHGSTLSRVVHASVLARLDPERAWTLFREALVADLDDTQGGTTGEGVHLGAMAGTVDILTRSFAGMRISLEGLGFDLKVPRELVGLGFGVRCQGQRIDVRLDGTGHGVVAAGRDSDLRVSVGGERGRLRGHGECTVTVGKAPSRDDSAAATGSTAPRSGQGPRA